MKVALVYDRVNKWGGAERVLLALHKLWPDAPLYTAVYDPKGAPWASIFEVRPSFMQYLPLARFHHELYPWLTPLAFETFSFDEFDVVLSITSAEAKNIITKPGIVHICYCLTPTRYLWSGYEEYIKNPGLGNLGSSGKFLLKRLASRLRRWDLIASERPDYYLAISQHVKKRIEKYYRKTNTKVIYPPVDLRSFKVRKTETNILNTNDYFLVVSRLVGYKRLDIIIQAFNELGWPLKIIGSGLALRELRQLGKKNIRFVTNYLTETELVRYYQNCRALIIAADEDFGLTAVEAQACGIPVVSYALSGVAEIVIDGKTGVIFPEQSKVSLVQALQNFVKIKFNPKEIRKNALRFEQKIFETEMKKAVDFFASKI